MQVRLLFTGGERWGRYYQVRDPDSPVLDLLNVRYVISNGALASSGGLVRRENLPGNVVWESPGAMPRFFMVGRIRTASDMDHAIRTLRSSGFDPRNEAVVEGPVESPTAAGSVRVVSYNPREVRLETEAPAGSFLVSSESWYPGWRATVDGIDRPLSIVNGAFRGLAVPGGRHTIVMRFDPPILWRSALVSLLGLAVVALLWLRDNKTIQGSRWISSSN
jgi:hypothetical protein